MYKTTGQDYNMVCEAIGWDKNIRAVEVMRRGQKIYCTGTLLKPQEWGLLISNNGKRLSDGSTLEITHIPNSL